MAGGGSHPGHGGIMPVLPAKPRPHPLRCATEPDDGYRLFFAVSKNPILT